MKSLFKQIQSGCIAALLTVFIASPVLAEDIEIYKVANLSSSSVNPNIMFILDTSGSMSTNFIRPLESYDPNHDYSAEAGNCFDPLRMYPSSTSEIQCTDAFKARSFLIAQNRCDGLETAFDITGLYSSSFAQWNPTGNTWGFLNNETDDTYLIECVADQGVHGDNRPQYKWINVTGTADPFTNSDVDAAFSWGTIDSDSLTLYSGNWMNYKITAQLVPVGSEVERIEVMKSAITTVARSLDDVNMGMMRFDGTWNHKGGSVTTNMQNVSDGRESMLSKMKNWTGRGWTPLSETLYEAYLYFSGGEVHYGDIATPKSVGESQVTGTNPQRYASPVDPVFAECQKQFIIYLSDGEPTEDSESNAAIEALPGFTNPTGTSTSCSPNGVDGQGNCLDDLAAYMFNHGFDAVIGKGASAVTIEDVKLATYTIGFGGDIPILSETARVAGGEYKIANSESDLLTTIFGIINSIRDIHSTFSSPAVSVNAFNRTTHRNDLYFTLFKPGDEPHWDGNFKQFKLLFNDAGIPIIVDQNEDVNNSAIGPNGFFKDDAMSFWTASADAPNGDGRDTSLGGAASKMFNGTPYAAGRKVYTSITNNALSHNSNRVWRATTGVREAMGWDGNVLDTVQTDYYNNLVDWVRGIDVDDNYGNGIGGLSGGDGDNTDARPVMGDPLHAQPALIQYGGTDLDPDITAYVATNDGLLHAISTRDGVEQFAFLPPELLPDMSALYLGSGGRKYYGLDGTISPYIIDKDVDGIIEPADGDKVYIFFGMRRGGSNIYAMDVTDRDNPLLMWTIRGGVDVNGDPIDTSLDDYSHLGQTWSRPSVRIVTLNGNDVPVLVFGGGYDVDQDSKSLRTADTIGQGIYIVNALTGETLWRMGPDGGADLTDTNMQYSIPSDVSAVDTDGDGYLDHIYVGDMGGQLWRVDIDNSASDSSTNLVVTGGRIADLADNTVSTNRRFYYPPSVAISKDINDDVFTALVMTSGYRAHPTNRNIQDRIFMIRDLPVNGKPVTYDTVVVNNTTEDLYNATDNIIGQGTTTQQDAARVSLTGADGWYIDLDMSTGEKGLTKSLIFAGEIFLTTFEPFDPSTATTVSCEPQTGTGYLYHLFLADAQPVKNYDTIVSNDPDALTVEDRKVKLARTGIPADPTIITTGEGSARCVGTECDRLDAAGTHKTIYWFEE